MGQQQLLLIVLSVIIVGVAIAVGVNMFQSSAVDANRQAMITDLVNYSAKAQRYYRTPSQLGGGAQSFNGFYLSAKDTGNANGSYLVATSQPSGTSPVSGSMSNVSGSSGTIYITGSGVETGDDGSNPVKAYTRVTADSISTVILN